jgi:glycosyltransferase involved in cell wall biosynthesis
VPHTPQSDGPAPVSIIIPVYNKAEYIEPCLRSLLTQQPAPLEIICVDDGSTDASGSICDRMARDDSRIRVIHTPNGGVTAARRRGWEVSRGRYVLFVDADDGLLPGALQLLTDAIERTGADEVIATFRTHDGVQSPVVYEGFADTDALIRAIITGKNRFPVLWSIIFRREVLDGVLDTPRDIVEGEDKLMQVKLLIRQPKVFFIKEPAYIYTLGVPNSRRHTLQREQLYDRLLADVLAPRADAFRTAFALHQLKEYERFILDGHPSVRHDYYLQAVGSLPPGIPLYDRLVFALPPRLARPIIKLYRKLIAIKQKGL